MYYYNYVTREVSTRDWDECVIKDSLEDATLLDCDGLDINSHCEHIDIDDYEQEESEYDVDDDECSGDQWEDLGCSWRDFI